MSETTGTPATTWHESLVAERDYWKARYEVAAAELERAGKALAKARQEEREACAAIADKCPSYQLGGLGRRIQARSESDD